MSVAVNSSVFADCPHCNAENDAVDLWDASIESFDGDQITMRAEVSCESCGDSYSVIWYSTIHSTEVEE